MYVEIKEIKYPGRNMARLFPIQVSSGLRGVAKRDSILPLTFSWIMVRFEKDQIKVINTDNGRKYAIRPIISSSANPAVSFPMGSCLLKTMIIIKEAAMVIAANSTAIIRKALVWRSSLKSRRKTMLIPFKFIP